MTVFCKEVILSQDWQNYCHFQSNYRELSPQTSFHKYSSSENKLCNFNLWSLMSLLHVLESS